jgi:hypothetical protein
VRFILGIVLGAVAGYKVTQALSARLEERQAFVPPEREPPPLA